MKAYDSMWWMIRYGGTGVVMNENARYLSTSSITDLRTRLAQEIRARRRAERVIAEFVQSYRDIGATEVKP